MNAFPLRIASFMPSPLAIARNASGEIVLLPGMSNRHGLVTGATGTGKTVSLQVMAARFSMIGVPVFMADVKGDPLCDAAPMAARRALRASAGDR
jgi:hypothetical protein